MGRTLSCGDLLAGRMGSAEAPAERSASANAQDCDVPAQCRIERVPQQRRRAAVGAGLSRHVMAVENQPAVGGDGFVECAIDAVAVDIPVDQRGGAQELQIRRPRC